MKHRFNAPGTPDGMNPLTVETIPYKIIIEGDMTLPIGTPHDAVKAAIMAQLTMSVSLGSTVKSFAISTDGISIAKG